MVASDDSSSNSEDTSETPQRPRRNTRSFRRPRRLSTERRWGRHSVTSPSEDAGCDTSGLCVVNHNYNHAQPEQTSKRSLNSSLSEAADGVESLVPRRPSDSNPRRLRRRRRSSLKAFVAKLPSPKPLYEDVPPESSFIQVNTGVRRKLIQPLHNHATHASQEQVPGYQCEMPLPSLIEACRGSRAAAAECWYPRTVYNYVFGEPRRFIGKFEPAEADKPSEKHLQTAPLQFESRFESGNLTKAIQVAPYGYELAMQNDVNTRGNTQWFYFACSNMVVGEEYTFWIRNFYKKKSLYNDGMMPVAFSMAEADAGWKRCGTDICYYKSELRRQDDKGFLYCLCFKHRFMHSDDTVYFANHYPYTFTNLQRHLHDLQTDPQRGKTFRRKTLCHSLAGNPIDMITVTDPVKKPEEMKHRRRVVISARVHPGEVNASYMMKGVLDFLTGSSEEAMQLRNMYIFSLIPMLNPDGVINGNYRTSLLGRDLNRQWLRPKQSNMPSIYSTKKLLSRLVSEASTQETAPVEFYIDLHGHSRAKGVFTYGCAPKKGQRTQLNMLKSVALPWLVSKLNPAFEFNACTYNISKSKKATGRVVSYMECGVSMSYTLEASFMGGTDGVHFVPESLQAVGEALCVSLRGYACVNATLESNGQLQNQIPWCAVAELVGIYGDMTADLMESLSVYECEPHEAPDDTVQSDTDSEDSSGSDSDPSAGNMSSPQLEIVPPAIPTTPAPDESNPLKPKPRRKRKKPKQSSVCTRSSQCLASNITSQPVPPPAQKQRAARPARVQLKDPSPKDPSKAQSQAVLPASPPERSMSKLGRPPAFLSAPRTSLIQRLSRNVRPTHQPPIKYAPVGSPLNKGTARRRLQEMLRLLDVGGAHSSLRSSSRASPEPLNQIRKLPSPFPDHKCGSGMARTDNLFPAFKEASPKTSGEMKQVFLPGRISRMRTRR